MISTFKASEDLRSATPDDSAVSVVIVEDHDLIRLSVRLSLESSGQVKVVGEATNGNDGLALAKNTDAQVILMDLGLPELNGIEATQRIKETTSKKVVVLTSHADEKSIISALRAGADGFVMKDTKTEDLLLALYSVAHGASWLEDSIARKVALHLFPRAPFSNHNLSDQDMRIITLLKSGMSIAEVSRELCLPLHLVHDQVTSALRITVRADAQNEALNAIPLPESEIEPAMICTRCRARVLDEETCPDDGSTLVNDPLIGTNLSDRYLILSLLGTGGNGAVYKARHRFTGKIVAVKIMHSDLTQSLDLVNRFRQEAITVAALEHANLVSVTDFGMTSDGIIYMVMDYLEGKSLISIVREQGPLHYRKAIPIFMEVCDGVSRAHEAGIIHRDLKPGNVHICNENQKGSQVKVLDFGLAKVHGENNIVMTVPGEIFGSPAFMSPEQCRGAKLDIRSDVYSMGCLMFQVLTGETAFQAQSAPEVMYHQIYTPPTTFDEIIAENEIPRLVEAVVFKCLRKDPNDRYQSMYELKKALEMCVV